MHAGHSHHSTHGPRSSSERQSRSELEMDGLPEKVTPLLRGVRPEDKEYYERALRSGTFICLDDSRLVVESDAINDDYCDCRDGSDEPGTSACENGRFFCENKGHKPKILSSMFVDDGVCDCCDGTDESGGDKVCENTCRSATSRSRNENDLFEGSQPKADAGAIYDEGSLVGTSSLSVSSAKTAAEEGGDLTTTGTPVWLVIGIPTVPRKEDYLERTLEALLKELPDVGEDQTNQTQSQNNKKKIKVVVMNNSPGNHTQYYRLKYRWTMNAKTSIDKAKHYLEFVENPKHCDWHPELSDPDDMNNPLNIPGHQVRQQSCDLLSMIEHNFSKRNFSFAHYLFMEDDFITCANMVHIISYLIGKVERLDPDWLAIRLSFGMNGILMKALDLLAFKHVLQQGLTQLPPDLIYQEWLEQMQREENRTQYIYEHNLLDHIGSVSSFSFKRPERPEWPGCFQPLAAVWSFALIEKFDLQKCRHSDISPCSDMNHEAHQERWNTTNQQRLHYLLV